MANETGNASATVELVGTVDRIIYSNPDSAYTVAVLIPEGTKQEITIVGPLAGIRPSQVVKCQGRFEQDKRFGRQFKVYSFESTLPTTLAAIERYLSSGLIKGIGKHYAKKLVSYFGKDIFDVIEKAPERLAEVEGIGKKRIEEIKRSWEEQRSLRDIMLFLQEHEISPSLAPKVFAQYGPRAIEQLKRNPYQLALDIRGIGFKRADTIAQKLGIPRESLERVKAGAYYFLHELAEDGHTYFPAEPFLERASEVLEVPPSLVVDALNALKEERYVVLERLPDETGAVYLRNLHQHEVGVAKLLATILYTPKLLPLIDVTKELNSFQSEYRFDLAPEQRVAVEAVCKGGIVVITGGPGTGKTTIVKTILHLLGKKNLRVLLAAPTGRAAKRLQELTHHPASTIHRLLQYSPRDGGFLRNRRNPLRADFIVVDEASMVDITLAYHLLQAVDARTSLVFVGDVDQLPSVGPGNVLRDLIESNCLEVVRLTQIFRQAGNSLIVTNAHRINHGEMPILSSQSGKADFQFLKRETPEEVLESIKELLLETFPRVHHLDPVRDVQIITPMHRGVIGAQNLNRELQSLLNPAGVALERAGGSLRVGDKVMQRANDYDKDVYNGDTGLIVGIDREERIVKVRFDHRIVVYDFSDLDQIELAYAVTVHKSQGSEYPAVIIPIHFTHAIMLQRNLLYTAVTRGRKLVYILGQWGALRMAVENANLAPRYSALHLRLQSECRQKNA